MSGYYNATSNPIYNFGSQMTGTNGVMNPSGIQMAGPGQAILPANVMGPQASTAPGPTSGALDFGVAQAPVVGTPDAMAAVGGAGSGGFLGGIGGLEGVGAIIQGISSLGQAYAAIKGVQMAQKQFKFTKDAYKTNLANQRESYNTQVEDRIGARAQYAGYGKEKTDRMIDKRSI
jgi:hypothetical protein